MFIFDLGSVRWEMLGATAGFMVVIGIAHFAYLKPAKQRLEKEVARSKKQMAMASLYFSVSSLATKCLDMANHADPSIASSGEVFQARRDVVGAGGHPRLEQTLRALEDAMASLEAALKEGDNEHVQAKKLAVAQASLVVTVEAGSLLGAHDA